MKYKQKKLDKLKMRHSYLDTTVGKSIPRKQEDGKKARRNKDNGA